MPSEIIVAIITGSVTILNVLISTFINMISKKQQEKRLSYAETQKQIDTLDKRVNDISTGVQSLLRNELIRSHEKYVVIRKFCPVWAKENINRVYKAYKALGGNDIGSDLYEEICDLPTELLPKEEEEES